MVSFLLTLELPRLVFRRRFVREDDSRRLLLGRATAVAAGVMAVSTVGLGVKCALGPPVLKRVQIPLAKLPRRLDGYRIAVVADIHLGKVKGRDPALPAILLAHQPVVVHEAARHGVDLQLSGIPMAGKWFR